MQDALQQINHEITIAHRTISETAQSKRASLFSSLYNQMLKIAQEDAGHDVVARFRGICRCCSLMLKSFDDQESLIKRKNVEIKNLYCENHSLKRMPNSARVDPDCREELVKKDAYIRSLEERHAHQCELNEKLKAQLDELREKHPAQNQEKREFKGPEARQELQEKEQEIENLRIQLMVAQKANEGLKIVLENLVVAQSQRAESSGVSTKVGVTNKSECDNEDVYKEGVSRQKNTKGDKEEAV